MRRVSIISMIVAALFMVGCQFTVTPPPVTTTTTTTVTTVVDPIAVGEFPGDVAPGFVRYGAGINGNGDPVARHESITGKAMGIRRTFWRWDQRLTSMINVARADLAAGRVPWVSVKTPGWTAMASGALDSEIDSMLYALGNLDGPVWLTVHHEPEGGNGTPFPDDPVAGAPGWLAMQKQVRKRIEATGVDNVAFASILMSWTWDARSNRNPDDWWADDVWDFVGLDHYMEKESTKSFENPAWDAARDFYTDKGMKIAVGEWGNRGTDQEAADEIEDIYNMAIDSGFSDRAQIIGLAAFDSNLNSPNGGWELKGEQLTRFRELLLRSTSLLANEDGF